MPPFGKNALPQPARARVEAALRADPALAEELGMIEGFFEPGARERFWRALAAELAGHRRPAAAVLAALERAARDDGE